MEHRGHTRVGTSECVEQIEIHLWVVDIDLAASILSVEAVSIVFFMPVLAVSDTRADIEWSMTGGKQ